MAPTPENWLEAIGRAAERYMTARVCFYRTKNTKDPSKDFFENLKNEGEIEILWHGKARVQHLRTPSQFDADTKPSANRFFRFQTPRKPALPMPFMEPGISARVLNADPHGDTSLELLLFSVLSSINASTQAVKTTELQATMKQVDWKWRLDENGMVVPA